MIRHDFTYYRIIILSTRVITASTRASSTCARGVLRVPAWTELPPITWALFFSYSHYWIQALCRVPNALGKGYFALGKAFAEGSTRQRASGKKSVGKEFFAECLLLSTRQSLCRVPDTRQS